MNIWKSLWWNFYTVITDWAFLSLFICMKFSLEHSDQEESPSLVKDQNNVTLDCLSPCCSYLNYMTSSKNGVNKIVGNSTYLAHWTYSLV